MGLGPASKTLIDRSTADGRLSSKYVDSEIDYSIVALLGHFI